MFNSKTLVYVLSGALVAIVLLCLHSCQSAAAAPIAGIAGAAAEGGIQYGMQTGIISQAVGGPLLTIVHNIVDLVTGIGEVKAQMAAHTSQLAAQHDQLLNLQANQIGVGSLVATGSAGAAAGATLKGAVNLAKAALLPTPPVANV